MNTTVKDYRPYRWGLNRGQNILFYGCGEKPTEHHNGNSSPVVKGEVRDGVLHLFTQSGAEYLLLRAKMIPNLPSQLILQRILGEGGNTWD